MFRVLTKPVCKAQLLILYCLPVIVSSYPASIFFLNPFALFLVVLLPSLLVVVGFLVRLLPMVVRFFAVWLQAPCTRKCAKILQTLLLEQHRLDMFCVTPCQRKSVRNVIGKMEFLSFPWRSVASFMLKWVTTSSIFEHFLKWPRDRTFFKHLKRVQWLWIDWSLSLANSFYFLLFFLWSSPWKTFTFPWN